MPTLLVERASGAIEPKGVLSQDVRILRPSLYGIRASKPEILQQKVLRRSEKEETGYGHKD